MEDNNAEPIVARVGAYFASLVDSGIFVCGERPIQLLAQHLISRGEDPSRTLEVHHGSKISRTTLGHAGGMR